MQHVIKKQIISLRVDESLDSFRIQQQISDYFWRDMLPLLEKEFDKISAEEELISLDRVEIDLGVILEDEVNTMVWNTNVIDLLRKEIAQQESAQLMAANESGLRCSLSGNSFQAWFFYMQQGYLPWNVMAVDEPWYEQVLEELAANYNSINLLRKAVNTNEVLFLRIIRQHPLSFLIRLVEALTAEKQSALFEDLRGVYAQLSKPSAVESKASGLRKSEQRTVALQALYENTLKEILISASPMNGRLSAITPVIRQQLKQALKAENEAHDEPSVALNQAAETQPVSALNHTGERVFSAGTDAFMKQLRDDGTYVGGVGLVLVHPFIPALFNLVGFSDNKQFINLKAQERAVYLLHYVTTGQTKAEEYDLLIPKMLCAFDMSLAINKQVKLLKRELKEADHMLKAAIASWGILKKTSPEGLREGFLRRKGKIYVRNERIHLLVEKSGIDVLLDQLPWTLSIIKYPWLKDFIKIEWR